ncbi:MAG: hypothetical protein WC530_04030 [Candidatus Omnitrophota bacterium]
MITQGKADFRMTVPGRVVFRRIARGKEVLAKSGPLTENRAQDPVDSVMVINLFSATGKVTDRSAKAIEHLHSFRRKAVFSGFFS